MSSSPLAHPHPPSESDTQATNHLQPEQPQEAGVPSLSGRKRTRDSPEDVEESRRQLRVSMHEFRSGLVANKAHYVQSYSESTQMLQKLNQHSQHIHHPREARLDADSLYAVAEIGVGMVKKLSSSQQWTVQQVTEKMRAKFMVFDQEHAADSSDDDEAEDFSLNWPLFRNLPGLTSLSAGWPVKTFLHSCFASFYSADADGKDSSHKPRSNKRIVKEIAPESQPEELSAAALTREEKSQTDHRVVHLLNCLPVRGSPQCFFRTMLHPRSYTKSVENLFDLSFLIKKGEVWVYPDEDNGNWPMIERYTSDDEQLALAAIRNDPTLSPEEKDRRERLAKEPLQKIAKELPSLQAILTLDMNKWRELVDTLEIKQPFIQREEEDEEEEDQHPNRTNTNNRFVSPSRPSRSVNRSSANTPVSVRPARNRPVRLEN